MTAQQKLVQVRAAVVEPLAALLSAAEADRVPLLVISGYRSFQRQCGLYRDKLGSGFSAEYVARTIAVAGASEHQLGLAVDFTSERLLKKLAPRFSERPPDPDGVAEYSWLAENAHRFGFALSYPYGDQRVTGYEWEPWHYRFIGTAAIQQMRTIEGGLGLHDYLTGCEQPGRWQRSANGYPTPLVPCPRLSATDDR